MKKDKKALYIGNEEEKISSVNLISVHTKLIFAERKVQEMSVQWVSKLPSQLNHVILI